MALAYPEDLTSKISSIVGRDAFLEALGNPRLRVRILEREPRTLEDALNAATRLEAFDQGNVEDIPPAREDWSRKQKHVKVVQGEASKAVNAGSTFEPESEVKGMLAELGQEVRRLRDMIGRSEVVTGGGYSSGPGKESNQPLGQQQSVQGGHGQYGRGRGRGRAWPRPDDGTSKCRRCGKTGHWQRECPRAEPSRSKNCGIAQGDKEEGEVYIRAVVNGKRVMALLDTGCQISIMGSRILSDLQLEPTTRKLFAANGTAIPLLGETTVDLQIGRQQGRKAILVSEMISEMILGIDWLRDNQCYWDFSKGRIAVGSVWIQLYTQPGRASFRKIYVGEDTVVPARQAVNVPAQVVWPSRRPEAQVLMTEARELTEGVLGARTMIPSETFQSAVKIMNLTSEDFTLKKGMLLARAEPVEIETVDVNPGNPDGKIELPHVTRAASTDLNGSENLTKMIQGLPDSLTPEQRRRAVEFIKQNATVFSRSEFDLGRTSLVTHTIDTEGFKTIQATTTTASRYPSPNYR